MKKIIFFNHKGGVSKTTTTYNIGWILAKKGKKVLIVDADPQCNLSGLILGDDFEKYYSEPTTKDQNIKDGVKPAFEAKPKSISAVNCFSPKQNNNLFLLAGHADLSEYDASLSLAQNSHNAIATLQNLPGAFNELIELTASKYSIDFVLIDLNPGLSAINQNLFVICDYFILPTNPDPFSIMALNTLSRVLPRWVDWSTRVRSLFTDSAYPLPETTPKFLGEVIQRFNIRKGKAAKPYRDNIAEIKTTVNEIFVPALKAFSMVLPEESYQKAGITDHYCIAEIPDFQGLLPKSIDTGVPVFELTDKEIGETGPVLTGMVKNRDSFNKLFNSIADKLLQIIADE